MLYAIVHESNPKEVVTETLAPIEASSFSEAIEETVSTFGAFEAGWMLVKLTDELDRQYPRAT